MRDRRGSIRISKFMPKGTEAGHDILVRSEDAEKKEHEASTAEGQEKINSHFQLPAEQAQELIVDKIPPCNETLGHGNNSQSEN